MMTNAYPPATANWSKAQQLTHKQLIANFNARILVVTMSIRKEFPELSKYIEEMPITVPINQHPAITLKNLKDYYGSLSAMLTNYRDEHTDN